MQVRLLQDGLWSKLKQSKHEDVTLVLAGASPADHPTGMLTVKTPKLPVKQLPHGQLGASPSIPTSASDTFMPP